MSHHRSPGCCRRRGEDGELYYSLEFTVRSANFFRHNLSVYASRWESTLSILCLHCPCFLLVNQAGAACSADACTLLVLPARSNTFLLLRDSCMLGTTHRIRQNLLQARLCLVQERPAVHAERAVPGAALGRSAARLPGCCGVLQGAVCQENHPGVGQPAAAVVRPAVGRECKRCAVCEKMNRCERNAHYNEVSAREAVLLSSYEFKNDRRGVNKVIPPMQRCWHCASAFAFSK